VERNLHLEEAAVAVVALGVILVGRVGGLQVPIGNMAGRALDLLEELFAAFAALGDFAAGGGWMVQQVPLGHIEIAFADLLAVTVAVGIVQTDPGRPAHAAAV